jgi:ABC-2 type transport system ATP-binding protein
VDERVIPLDGDGAAAIQQALAEGEVLTIHSEEATLEDIFVHFAGRGLDA